MRNLWIEKDIEYRADAKHGQNVKGPQMEKMVHLHDHFLGIALDTTNDWASAVPGSSDTIAINAAVGGHVRMTTGTVDNDSCMLSSELTFEGDKNCVMEARVRLNDVSGTAVFVGFSDAKSEDNLLIAISYPDDTVTYTATNAVGFVIDADHATSSIMCCGVKAATGDTPVDSGTDAADAAWHTYRVEVKGDEATFYLDGTAAGYLDDAVTSTTDMCVTVQSMTRAGDGANTVDVDRIDAWQDE